MNITPVSRKWERGSDQLTRRSWCLAFVSVVLAAGLLFAHADPTRFSGQATVVYANVLGVETLLVNAGPLPEEGGEAEDSLLEASVPGLLSAEVLHASTIAQGHRSHSEASVAELNLTVLGNTISAGFLMAEATAQCQGGNASVSGSSQIAELVINGQAITVSGEPNQTIQAGPLRVAINEQQAFADGNFGDLTVNALHVTVASPVGGPPLADVVISSAHADIQCAGPPPPGRDFITGGGWITGTPSGAKANFGVAGGTKPNDALWGHLTYIDHGNGMKVKGTGVTLYAITGATSRHIEGTCEINGAAGTYQVDVTDNGEPGGNDIFTIRLSDGYTASGNLGGGNIQLHTP